MVDFKSWIVGFVDGEGSFHILLFRFPKMKSGYQVRAIFAIGIHKDDIEALEKIRDFFGFGNITKGGPAKVQYRVSSLDECVKIMKFFDKNKLQAKKYYDYLLWRECVKMMLSGEHLTLEGIRKVAKMRQKMNPAKADRKRTQFVVYKS